jgi:hypothetical protein
MKRFLWDPTKAKLLLEDSSRGGIGFEDCVVALEAGRLLADIPNPSPGFTHQRMFVLLIQHYAYVVPYVETEDAIFLKTVFPSRKMTAIYLKDDANGS